MYTHKEIVATYRNEILILSALLVDAVIDMLIADCCASVVTVYAPSHHVFRASIQVLFTKEVHTRKLEKSVRKEYAKDTHVLVTRCEVVCSMHLLCLKYQDKTQE